MSKFVYLPETKTWVNMDTVAFVTKDRDHPESIVLKFAFIDNEGVDSMLVSRPNNVNAVLNWLSDQLDC